MSSHVKLELVDRTAGSHSLEGLTCSLSTRFIHKLGHAMLPSNDGLVRVRTSQAGSLGESGWKRMEADGSGGHVQT